MAAVQAGLSVALLLVVYLTLLRPDSGDELPGAVNAERGTELEAEGSFPRSPGEDRGGPAGSPGSEGPLGEGAPLPGQLGGTAPESAAGPGGPSGGYEGGSAGRRNGGFGPSTADLDEDPTGDQYADEVSRLLGRVRAAD